MLIADRRMSKSIAGAVLSDGQILLEAQNEEEAAATDRDIARGLSRGSTIHGDVSDGRDCKKTLADDELLKKLSVLYIHVL
jgi:hypothetical protein